MELASIFETLIGGLVEKYWAQIGMLVVLYAAKKWVVPLLQTAKAKEKAQLIAQIADDVTDELVASYPKSELWSFLDKAVDKVKEVCKIKDPQVARRAMSAALKRKGIERPK